MKHQNTIRRAVSMLLCVLLLCGLLPPVYAEEVSNAITSAEMAVGSTQAQIKYTAEKDAVVIAALYEADTGRMLTVGVTEATAGSETVLVQMSQARQEGDELKAFLVDKDSYAPLTGCYTEEVQTDPVREYFEENAELLEIIKADGSDNVLNETEAETFLDNRGLGDYAVSYEYSISGDQLDETAIIEGTTEQHPMYQTVYVAENGDEWLIYVINDAIFAYPFSFNLESDLGAELIFSESNTLTSYDNVSNQFFVTIPHESEMIVETVETINAETLDRLTVEEICRLSGATLPELMSEDDENSDETALFCVDVASLFSAEESVGSYTSADPFIVVSLGDSYSSGEGIEDFYGQKDSNGQDEYLGIKVCNPDWLAHRSTQSWPGRIIVPGTEETLNNYRVPYRAMGTGAVQWYFGAASGAETKNFDYNATDKDTKNGKQRKDYHKQIVFKDTQWLPNQMDIFNYIDDLDDVDYVTLTIGGNDVDFATVIALCCIEPTYLKPAGAPPGNPLLEVKLALLWANIDSTMANIRNVYQAIHDKVPNAAILVAGYPKLLDKNGKGAIFSKHEADIVNEKIHMFNEEIRTLVESCEAEYHTYYVDVEKAFDEDGGHQAYSEEAWINPVWLTKRSEDLEDGLLGTGVGPSAYSMHPNWDGAQAYARCVNAVIADIESRKEATFNGHRYRVFNEALTWTEAQAYCEGLGGHLATLTSTEENDYVYQLVRNAGYTSAYFGFTDCDVEGTWVWITGEPTSFTNWHSGEPNNDNGSANEDFAMFYYKYSDGSWNDGDFGGSTENGGTAFICEWDTEAAYNAHLNP